MTSTVLEIDRDTWDQFWSRIEFANLQQSWEYGEAKVASEGWKPKRFLIRDELGTPLALAQVLVRAWPIIGGIARLNRGPLLIDTTLCHPKRQEKILQALRSLQKRSHLERWRLFFVAPELEASELVMERLSYMGLRQRNKVPWGSARLSLVSSEDVLLANLRGKWRNMLRKAQKSGLTIECSQCDENDMEMILSKYKALQQKKGFSGISDELLRQLAVQTGSMWRFELYVAYKTEVPDSNWCGMLISIVHGDTATYLLGHTDDVGRKTNANYLMLWQAIIANKQHGCKWFDLGGINANTPKGIVRFKEGIGGIKYTN